MWLHRRKKVQGDVERARKERIASEVRLEDARQNVITPLAEIRRQNHIPELFQELIRRKVERQS